MLKPLNPLKPSIISPVSRLTTSSLISTVQPYRLRLHEELNKLGDFLREHPKSYVVLSGYTDSVGSDEYNLRLARRRAEKCSRLPDPILWCEHR